MNTAKSSLLMLFCFVLLFCSVPLFSGTWIQNEPYEFSIYFPGDKPVKESNTADQTTYTQISGEGKVTQHYDSVFITRGSLYEASASSKQSLKFENFNDFVNEKLVYDTGEFIAFEGQPAFKYQLTNHKNDFEDEKINGLLIESQNGIIHLKTIEYQGIPQAGIQYYSNLPYTDYFFESFYLW